MAKTYKYKLTRGKHTDRQGPYGELDRDGNARRTLRYFKQGDVFESPTDLAKAFNSANSIKFEPLEDGHRVPSENMLPNDPYPAKADEPHPAKTVGGPKAKGKKSEPVEEETAPEGEEAAEGEESTPYEEGTLEAMTVPELKKMAHEEEIDLHGATTKADIIAAIRASV